MKKTRIVAFGDSLTAGSALGAFDLNWTDHIAADFEAEVFNAGVGGNTTADGLARIDRDVLSKNPDIVLICFGMNDHVIADADGRTNISEDQFQKNLVEMITRIRGVGAYPILITPNAVIEDYYYTRHPSEWYASAGGVNAQLNRFCNMIRHIALDMKVSLVDLFAESIHMDLKQLLRTPDNGGFEDGVHPYGDGILFYKSSIEAVLNCKITIKYC